MKKLLILLLSVLFLVCAACAEDAALPIPFWRYDGVNHWQLDESGAVVSLGAHTPGDDLICTGCGSEILDWGDGEVDVTVYDAYGNVERYTSFIGEERTYESVHVYTYNEDGLLLKDVEYVDGVRYGMTNFAISEEGVSLPVNQVAWSDDGTYSMNLFDEHGNCIQSTLYEADGTLAFETLSEYEMLEDEWFGVYYYECRTTSRFASGETFFQEVNRFGDILHSTITYADGTAWSDTTYEYEYRDGVKLWSKQYSFGTLTTEERYDAEGNLLQEIEHVEDGSTIVYDYNVNGDPVTVSTCAADGSLISQTTYTYVYDDNMTQLELHVYTDGQLVQSTVNHYDAYESFTGLTETIYHADGARTVTEYDDCLEPIQVIVYAADGSVSSEELYEAAAEEYADF